MTSLATIRTANTRHKLTFALHWPLARLLMFGLSGGFLGLMCDVRIEHVEVVHERAIAWTPILFAGVMGVACFVSSIWWNLATKRVMVPLFVLTIVVGAAGFYLHNDGHVLAIIRTVIDAWVDPHMRHGDAPPHLAPMAFAGLGALGLLTCFKRLE